jgi:hypothetical protein
MKKLVTLRAFCVLVLCIVAFPATAFAEGVFVVRPAKSENVISPGETKTVLITLANGMSTPVLVSASFEDLAPNRQTTALDEPIRLLGSETGANSLKEFLSVQDTAFEIFSGEERQIAVTISIPKNTEPGGRYGSVVFSFRPALRGEEGDAANITLESRAATLFFVRVGGEAREEGRIMQFGTFNDAKFIVRPSDASPLKFQIAYENAGTVHLNPYGRLTLDPLFFGKEKVIIVDPWVVLPGATRMREVAVSGSLPLGPMKAKLELNRGYADIVEDRYGRKHLLCDRVHRVHISHPTIVTHFKTLSEVNTMKRPLIVTTIIGMSFGVLTTSAFGYVASSTNYRIQTDSVNTGGTLSTSTSYRIEDTIGEAGEGRSSSATYNIKAGYQQMQETYLAISVPGNVSLAPDIPSTGGGIANGSATWTVTTDNAAGYSMTIAASTSPALASGGDSFANYTPLGGAPDFTFSVPAASSEFGFTPEGGDIATRYQDSGGICNIAGGDTASACWDPLTTTPVTIASRVTANHTAGTATTIRFRAESGASNTQPAGSYTALATLTVVAN